MNILGNRFQAIVRSITWTWFSRRQFIATSSYSIIGRRIERSETEATTSRWTIWAAVSVLLACAACGSKSHDVAEQPSEFSDQDLTRFEVLLKPVRERGTDVTAVEVRYELTGDILSGETLSLRSPIVYAGRTDMADSVTELVIRDGAGVVGLAVQDDPEHPGGFPYPGW